MNSGAATKRFICGGGRRDSPGGCNDSLPPAPLSLLRLPDRLLALALALLVASGVLFFGGAHPAVAAVYFAALAVLGAAVAAVGAARASLAISLTPLTLGAAALLLFGAGQVVLGTSLAPDRTREALLRYGAGVLVFVLASTFAREEGMRRRLALLAPLLASAEVLYGIFAYASRQDRLFFWLPHHFAHVTGTYVNRNHFAGMLAVAAPVCVGLALAGPRLPPWPRTLARRTRIALALGAPEAWQRALLLAAASLASLGVLLSVSRGGAIALAAGLGVTLALSARGAARRRAAGAVAVAIVAAGGWLLAFGPEPLVRRFSDLPEHGTDAGELSRLGFARRTLAMIAEHPLAGVGLGAFEAAYPRYQRGWAGGARVDHAHSDWLEITAEVGLPLAAALVAAAALTAMRAVGRARQGGAEARAAAAPLAYGLAGGLAAAAVHALVDFDLQLAGSLGWTAFVAGLLAGGAGGAVRLEGWMARALGAAGAAALLAAVPFATRAAQAEWAAWGGLRAREDRRPPSERLAGLERAIALRPDRVAYRLAVAKVRGQAFEAAVAAAAAEAARALAGEGAPPGLARALEGSVWLGRAAEHERLQARTLEDLRAARRIEPQNARVLAELARVTAERAEAFEAGAAAAAAAPFAADVLVRAALARLRFDPADARAAEWLARGLTLEPRLAPWTGQAALAEGAGPAAAFEGALPGGPAAVEGRRALAAGLFERGWITEGAAVLDRLAIAEEGLSPAEGAGAGAEGAVADGAGARGAGADGAGGPSGGEGALGARGAAPIRLAGEGSARVVVSIDALGDVRLELATLPGAPPAVVCAIADGRHAGHAIADGDWREVRLGPSSSGMPRRAVALELVLAPARHRLAGVPAGTVLVRGAVGAAR